MVTLSVIIFWASGGDDERDRYVIFVQGVCSSLSLDSYDTKTMEFKSGGPLQEVRAWLELKENGGYTGEFFRYFSYNYDPTDITSYVSGSATQAPGFIIPYEDGATLKPISESSLGIPAIYASIPEGAQIDIISHSMGGVVALFALSENEEIRKRTHSVITFDSPLKGSALWRRIVGPGCLAFLKKRLIFLFGAGRDLGEGSYVIKKVREFEPNSLTVLSIANLADNIVPDLTSWLNSEFSVKVRWRIRSDIKSHDIILKLPNEGGEPLLTIPVAACTRLALRSNAGSHLPKCLAISDAGRRSDEDGGIILAATPEPGDIDPGDDVDIYVFEAIQSQTATITVKKSNQQYDSNNDNRINLTIFDSLGKSVTADSEQNADTTTASFDVTANGGYIVRVYSDDWTGRYELKLDLQQTQSSLLDRISLEKWKPLWWLP